jgi:hypothetical protein
LETPQKDADIVAMRMKILKGALTDLGFMQGKR